MSRIPKLFGGFRSILMLLVFALVTTLIIIPGIFNVTDASVDVTGKNGSDSNRLPKMYDIRDSLSEEKVIDDVSARLEAFRTKIGMNAAAVADLRDGFVRGEERLKQQFPNLKVEYNTDIRIPEVISSDMMKNQIDFLTGPTGNGGRVDTLKSFLKSNSDLVGVTTSNIDRLKTGADYKNPDGVLGFVRLEQEINGLPIFRAEVNAMFTKDGRMVRIINNLAPGIDETNSPTDFGDPTVALKMAADHVGWTLDPVESAFNSKASSDKVVIFGNGDWANTAEKMYFPTEPGVAVAAWRVLMWQGGAAFYVIVDANTNTILWRKNLSDEQTQTATFSVYDNPSAFMRVADSAAGLAPYISVPANDPTVNAQGIPGTRVNVTLIGNEGPLSFNNNGWINNDANTTDGNNAQAGSDFVSPDGIDFAEPGDSGCPGAGCRVFTSGWIPQPNAGAQEPFTDAVARRGANIQMFYIVNRLHDELYKVGFTEDARNFQQDNFGRGGNGGDRISAEGQDQTIGPFCGSSPCLNNAVFSTPADGGRGKMQMYLWSGHNPRRDGTGDADIVIHEISHGTSNRLVGNAGGLGGQGGMMGEGWGDWYASTLLAQDGEPVGGVYALSGYSTSSVNGLVGSYYYGIRRFPTAIMSTTGGDPRAACGNAPCPHNPLTFKHINSGCDTTLGGAAPITSAFRRNPVFGSAADCSGVHNAGEIWKIALWEVRAKMVTRLGFQAGTTRVLQAVTTGMKNTPANPNFLQARDGIIAAAAAQAFATPEASADVADVRDGFRIRGMGFSATVTSSTSVTEAFDFPNVRQADPFTVSEAPTGNDGDGFPEPGENLLLSIAVTNPNTGAPITGAQVTVNGGTPVNYGTINDGQTVVNSVPYTVPAGAVCGSMHQVSIVVSSSIGAQPAVSKEFRLGAPVGGAPASFTNSAAITIGTESGPAAPGSVYPSNVTAAGLTGNKVIKVTLNNYHHTWEQDTDFLLVGPGGQKFVFLSDRGGTSTDSQPPRNISFADNGATLAPTTPFIADTTYMPTNSDATDAFPAPAPASPYQNAAPAGAATFASTFGTDGSTMNGTWSLYAFDDASSDGGALDGGWTITFEANDFICGLASSFDVSGRVVTSGGRGISNASVTMVQGATTLVTRTSSFGYFTFRQVPGNIQYTMVPSAKRYSFTPQQVTPTAAITNIVFTAAP